MIDDLLSAWHVSDRYRHAFADSDESVHHVIDLALLAASLLRVFASGLVSPCHVFVSLMLDFAAWLQLSQEKDVRSAPGMRYAECAMSLSMR